MALLEIRDLIVRYGEIEALRGVSLSVEPGQVVTLLGANGAGKSTTLRAISGLAKPAAGDILFDGKSIAGLGPEAIVRMGISHVPEGRRDVGRVERDQRRDRALRTGAAWPLHSGTGPRVSTDARPFFFVARSGTIVTGLGAGETDT